MEVLGNGVYSFQEAAILTGLKAARVRSWFGPERGKRGVAQVFRGDYPQLETSISFLDLIEVLVAGNLREQGIRLAAIRAVHRILAKELATPHPFSHKELLTDGQAIFLRTAGETGDDQIVEIITSQHVFPKVLLPYLRRVSYDAQSLLAKEWKIFDGITVDPSRRYGKPIVASCGIPASILASAYHANGKDKEAVASWYGISADEVSAAVAFHMEYSGKAA